MEKIDHRRRYKGIIRDVRKALADSGVFISRVAVNQRIKTGRDELTMKLYAEHLKKFIALENQERARIGRNFKLIEDVMKRKERTMRNLDRRMAS